VYIVYQEHNQNHSVQYTVYILENKTPLRVLDGCGSKTIHLLGFLEKNMENRVLIAVNKNIVTVLYNKKSKHKVSSVNF